MTVTMNLDRLIEQIGPKTTTAVFAELEAHSIANGVTIINLLGKMRGVNYLLGIGNIRLIADIHDLLFHIGGDERDFHRANQVLRDAIIEKGYAKAKRLKGWYWAPVRFILRQRARRLGNLYFACVEEFGRGHFNWSPRRKYEMSAGKERVLLDLAIAA